MRPLLLLVLAACGSTPKMLATPAGTELVNHSLAKTSIASPEVRARLAPGAPPTEKATFDCGPAAVEIEFARLQDPETKGQYLDNVKVRVVDGKGTTLSSGRPREPVDTGTGGIPEMSLTVAVAAQWVDGNTNKHAACEFNLRATEAPAIRKL